jgi:hypothetical protein
MSSQTPYIDEVVATMTNVERNEIVTTILMKQREESQRSLNLYEAMVSSLKQEIVTINHVIEILTKD